jgi:hypothetical protein
MGKTSSKVKDTYNEREYARYTYRIRKDTTLYSHVQDFMNVKGTSLTYLITKLLEKHFDTIHYGSTGAQEEPDKSTLNDNRSD